MEAFEVRILTLTCLLSRYQTSSLQFTVTDGRLYASAFSLNCQLEAVNAQETFKKESSSGFGVAQKRTILRNYG